MYIVSSQLQKKAKNNQSDFIEVNYLKYVLLFQLNGKTLFRQKEKKETRKKEKTQNGKGKAPAVE